MGKTRGRPPKKATDKAERRVPLRVTLAEYNDWKRKAGKLPLSTWIKLTLNRARR